MFLHGAFFIVINLHQISLTTIFVKILMTKYRSVTTCNHLRIYFSLCTLNLHDTFLCRKYRIKST